MVSVTPGRLSGVGVADGLSEMPSRGGENVDMSSSEDEPSSWEAEVACDEDVLSSPIAATVSCTDVGGVIPGDLGGSESQDGTSFELDGRGPGSVGVSVATVLSSGENTGTAGC
ncbi:hypothetical protein R1sor_015280 [Riccia sorocarpa]|uniref:Uncharacterized protein n=1 Tax=Riccia sorocarpa TaxID=122646 RepID=A0ABD3HDR2_9MARC